LEPVRRNLVIGVLHETIWGVSFSLIDPVTILQLALRDLGGRAALAGLLGGLLFAGLALLQLPAAFWLSPRFSDPHRCAGLHLPALACTAGLALAFSLGLDPALLLKLYLVLATGFFLLIGLVIPYWIAMISRCVPEGVRGRYFAWCFALANLGGIASGALAVHWIERGGLEWGYGLSFGLALLLQLLSISLLLLLKPLKPAEAPQDLPLLPWLRSRLLPLLRRRPVKLFLIITLFMQLSSAPFNLFTDHLKERGLPTAWWAWLNAAKNVGGVLGSFMMGYLADRQGPRYSLGLAFALMAASLLLIPMAGPVSGLGAFFGGGFFTVAYPVMNLYLLLLISEPGQTTATAAAFATVTAPLVLGAPVLSGFLAQRFGHGASFAFSLLACALGAAFLFKQRDFGLKGSPA
jgi:MFS family permease